MPSSLGVHTSELSRARSGCFSCHQGRRSSPVQTIPTSRILGLVLPKEDNPTSFPNILPETSYSPVAAGSLVDEVILLQPFFLLRIFFCFYDPFISALDAPVSQSAVRLTPSLTKFPSPASIPLPPFHPDRIRRRWDQGRDDERGASTTGSGTSNLAKNHRRRPDVDSSDSIERLGSGCSARHWYEY